MDIKIKKPNRLIGCLILTVLMVFSEPCDGRQSHVSASAIETPSLTENHDNRFKPKLLLTAAEKAWLKAHPVITLGGGIFPPLEFFDETKGQPDGIGPDYAKLIGRMLGIKFKLVSGDWYDILQMAKAKEIDGLRLIFKNKAREKYLKYTKPYAKIDHAIVTQKNTKGIYSLKDLSHHRVATLKGIYSYYYMKDHYPNIGLITYPTWEKVMRALVNGEVDAIVGTLPAASYMRLKLLLTNFKVVTLPAEMARFAYLGIRPDWPELVAILNKAIDSITEEKHREIRSKWVTPFTNIKETKQVALTPEERAWLAQNHRVRVRTADWPPYIIVKGNEPPQGIVLEYLKLIGKRTGITFKYEVTDQPFAEFLESMKQHQGSDMTSVIVPTPEREKYLSFSETYISSPYVIFTREQDDLILDISGLSGKTIAVPRGFSVQKQLADNFPEIRLALFDSDEQALQEVATGRVDAYIGNLTVASHIIQKRGFSDLRVAAPSPFGEQSLSMGNRKDWPELTSIINKALVSITEEEKTAIRNKYVALRYEQGINRAKLLKWVLVIAGTASGIVLLFVFWNRNLARIVRERAYKLSESEKLFRATFEQAAVGIAHVGTDGRFLRLNRKFCNIVGYSHEEMLALTFQDITYPEDLDKDLNYIQELLDGKRNTYSREKRYIRKDATIIWINLTVSMIRKDNGKPDWLVGVVEDISARKQAEEQIDNYQERLKALASQLTVTEEKERRRIAVDLHDQIGQSLALARIQIAAAKKSAADDGLAAKLEDVSEILREAVQDTRHLIFDLSPPAMHEIGLGAAISEWLDDQIGKRYGLKTEFFDNIDQSYRKTLDENVRAILFRNVRELLINTVKHAQANQVTVLMEVTDNVLKIVVQDDGIGFDHLLVSQTGGIGRGFGLFSIKERMTNLGGALEIESQPGKGGRAILTVPLVPKSASGSASSP